VLERKYIYGVRAVAEALSAGARVNRVYFAKESRARAAKELAETAKAQGVRFDFVPQAKLNALAGTQEHQGIVASVSPVGYTTLEDFLAVCPTTACVLVLDHVQHPKNLGMLVRTAAAAGADALVLSSKGGALLDEAVLRASAGALFHVPVINARNVAQTLDSLKGAGFWVYGLDASEGESVFEVEWPARCVLVAGNETKGLRPGVRKACDAGVRIPLARNMDSLNVAVAAGVALFQVAAARR
jgi:23S rRNA (guanosine2251-2'-O)-methyltransferase